MTLRDLAEEVVLHGALDEYLGEVENKDETSRASAPRILKDEKARALADTPVLTGHPDYDRWELEETDPSKPPLELGVHA